MARYPSRFGELSVLIQLTVVAECGWIGPLKINSVVQLLMGSVPQAR